MIGGTIVMVLVAVIWFGAADLLIETKLSGSGTADEESYNGQSSGRVMVQNGNLLYQSKTTESQDLFGTSTQTFDHSGEIIGGDGSTMTQIVYKAKGAGVSQESRITEILGNASFTQATYLVINDETGAMSYDSVDESSGEQARFYARIVDARNGKPLTRNRLTGVGNWSVWKHVNVSQIRTTNDWLELCGTFSDDLIPDVGAKVVPTNDSETIKEVETVKKEIDEDVSGTK